MSAKERIICNKRLPLITATELCRTLIFGVFVRTAHQRLSLSMLHDPAENIADARQTLFVPGFLDEHR